MTELEKANSLDLYDAEYGNFGQRTKYIISSHREDDSSEVQLLREDSVGETYWDYDTKLCYFYYPDEETMTKVLMKKAP